MKSTNRIVFSMACAVFALGLASEAHAADQFTKVQGDGTCGAGQRLVEPWEAEKDAKAACGALGQWDIVRLGLGGSMGGPGYKCKINETDGGKLGHSLCVKAPDLPKAAGTYTWSVNGKPNGETTLDADGTCSNSASKMKCVWVLSDAAKRQFTLNWNNGRYIDTLVLAEDAKTIEGGNQGNDKIKGVRK